MNSKLPDATGGKRSWDGLRGAVMVCGTGSDVGKSHVVTGLCRLLARSGVTVAPFKAQNMALNSFVTSAGHEIGRAQGVQALAAGVEAEVAMNPILLKPTGERTSQVIVNGRPIGELAAAEYHELKPELLPIVVDALGDLRRRFDVVVIEGAGSPAEINLLDRDIVNLRLAAQAGVPAVVVGDIDRGGVFAALYGTVALLPDDLGKLIRGFIINKFRGDPALLGDGLTTLEDRCGVPTLGVLPFVADVALDAEDSLALDGHRPRSSGPAVADDLDVAVLRFPRLSNVTDLDALAIEAGVSVRLVERPEALGAPDLVVLPGTKATVVDLAWMRSSGLASAVAARMRAGSVILGICGGYQMLGRHITDEVESGRGTVDGLGWLDVATTFEAEKITRVRHGTALGAAITGYEIHHGRTRGPAPAWLTLARGGPGEAGDVRVGDVRTDGAGVEAEGAVNRSSVADATVFGTSLHGLFEGDAVRTSFLGYVARRRGKRFVAAGVSFAEARQDQCNRLADLVQDHLDLDAVAEVIASARPAGAGRQPVVSEAGRATPPPGMWRRPVPVIGDRTSAAERSARPDGWAFGPARRAALYDVIAARRDIRRYRPDPVDDATVARILGAAHQAPSVGQSQPWRFIVVSDEQIRTQAAWMADRERLGQAVHLEEHAARHLLDLQLDGIKEAPLGVVVCCDRRAPAAGVLGRATFPDADLWSCACAIENMWLAARAEGLGMGWVTLFQPDELAALLALPAGAVALGWLCLGWPDERPPEPGLERAGWSKRQPLGDVVVHERWPADEDSGPAPAPPRSRLRAPGPDAVVAARDDADATLTPLGSLGILDRAVDRAMAAGRGPLCGGTLILAAGRHRVADLGVSAFDPSVTDEVLAAARAGQSLGFTTAAAAGLAVDVVDAGSATGNLRDADALEPARVEQLLEMGRDRGRVAARRAGLVALGEVGVGNTVVAAALTAGILDLDAMATVGLGAGSDTAMVERRRVVVDAALARVRAARGAWAATPLETLAALGGPEFALLAGVTLGAVEGGAVVVLDGLATSVAALVASMLEAGVVAHLIAGQRSREPAHPLVLARLGLEPLLDLRFRAGEGAGACLAAGLLLHGLRVRAATARTGP